ncbi:unnamed protein product, partial [Rotaria sp. Silwood1]
MAENNTPASNTESNNSAQNSKKPPFNWPVNITNTKTKSENIKD